MTTQQQAFLCGYLSKTASFDSLGDKDFSPVGAKRQSTFDYGKFFNAIPEYHLPKGMATQPGQKLTPEMELKQNLYLNHEGFKTPEFRTIRMPALPQKPIVPPQLISQQVQPTASPEEQAPSTSWGDTILDYLRSQLTNQA